MAVRNFRKRYIVFRVHGRGALPRKEMIDIINRRGRIHRVRMKLTVFKGNRGIILVSHTDKEKAIEAMNFEDSGLKIETIRTSGTIKKAKNSMHQF